MLQKKCLECGEMVNSNEKSCPECGYIFEVQDAENEEQKVEENIENQEVCVNDTIVEPNITAVVTSDIPVITPDNSKRKKYKIIAIACGVVVLAAAIGAVAYINSDYSKYKKATQSYEDKNYEVAAERYKELKDYKDSEKMYEEASHLDAVQKDKIAPEIYYSSVNLEEGDEFDPETFVKDKVIAKDDVSGEVECKMVSSDVNVDKAGDYTIEVSAEDEAGNVQKKEVSVTVKKKYTVKNLKESVASIFVDNKIPSLYDVEYNEDSQVLYVSIMKEGMAEASVYASIHSLVKQDWDELADTLANECSSMYNRVISDGYTDIKAVSLILVNDQNTDKVLLSFLNNAKVYDATE